MRVIGMEHKPIKHMKKGKTSKNEEIKEFETIEENKEEIVEKTNEKLAAEEPEKVEENENENLLKED